MTIQEVILNKAIQAIKDSDPKALKLLLNKSKLKALMDDKAQLIHLINSIPLRPSAFGMLFEVVGEELLRHLIDDRILINEFEQGVQLFIYSEILKNAKTKALLIKNPEYLNMLILNLISNSLKSAKTLVLETIANDVEIVNSLNVSGRDFLALYFEFHLKFKPPLNAIARYYFAKKVGHVLGLSDDNKTFESNIPRYSLDWLIHSIDSYISSSAHLNTDDKDTFTEIKKTFQFSADLIDKSQSVNYEGAEQALYRRYQANEMIYINSGWAGHTVSLAIQGDYLIHSNRGQGMLYPSWGVQIFKIKDSRFITPDFIKTLMHISHISPAEFYQNLALAVDITRPCVVSGAQGQEHGNCSFANPKAAIQLMNDLVQMRKKGFKTIEQLEEPGFRASIISWERRYKDFSRYIRDEQIKEIITMAKASTTPEMDAYFINIVSQIIIQHHGQASTRSDAKKSEEINRIIALVQGLPPQMQLKIHQVPELENILRTLPFPNTKERVNQEKLNKPQTAVYEKAESIKAEPVQAVHAQETPAEVPPGQVAPAQVPPAKVTPVKVAPVKVAPVKVAPAQVPPVKVPLIKVEPLKPVKAEPVVRSDVVVNPSKKVNHLIDEFSAQRQNIKELKAKLMKINIQKDYDKAGKKKGFVSHFLKTQHHDRPQQIIELQMNIYKATNSLGVLNGEFNSLSAKERELRFDEIIKELAGAVNKIEEQMRSAGHQFKGTSRMEEVLAHVRAQLKEDITRKAKKM